MDLADFRKNIKDAIIDDLQKLISIKMLAVKYGSFFCENQTFPGLYRSRKHNHKKGRKNDGALNEFTNEKEYWNPPEKSIESYGRCNDIGESMFYCSNELEVAVVETRPSAGDFVTVSTFENIQYEGLEIKRPSFRVKPIGVNYLSQIKGFKSCIHDPSQPERSKEFQEMDLFLDSLFYEEVAPEENDKYKLTIAVTKIMLTNLINQFHAEKSIHGLIYSSIARDFKGVNILLKPSVANNHFFVRRLQTFEILESESDYITLRLVRRGRTKYQRTHPSQPKMAVEWFEIDDGDKLTIKL